MKHIQSIDSEDVTLLGDVCLVEVLNKQDDSIIVSPDDVHRGTLKAVVRYVGKKVLFPELKSGTYVLIRNFVGAPHIIIKDIRMRLYSTEHIVALLTTI